MEGSRAASEPYRAARHRSSALPVAALLVVGAVAIGLWWSTRQTLEAEIAEHRVDPASLVALDDETRVAVRSLGPGTFEAFYFDHDLTRGWDAGVGRSVGAIDVGSGTTVSMMGWGGEDTLGWSTLLYGVGPMGTASVTVTGGLAVGAVSDPLTGAFFIASRNELTPDDIRYRLLDADGHVLFEGRGLGPAEMSPGN